MSDNGSISLGDNPFESWASHDDLRAFDDGRPLTTDNDLDHSSFGLHHPESDSQTDETRGNVSVLMGNTSLPNLGHRSSLRVEPEHQSPSSSSDESLDFQDAIFSDAQDIPLEGEESSSFLLFRADQPTKMDDSSYGSADESLDFQDAFTTTKNKELEEEFSSLFDFEPKHPSEDPLYNSEHILAFEDEADSRMDGEQEPQLFDFEPENDYPDLFGKSEGSHLEFEESPGTVSYPQQYEDDRKKTISFAYFLSTNLDEVDPLENSTRKVDIFAMGPGHRSSSSSQAISVPDGSDDDDSAFMTEEDEREDEDKEIHRTFMFCLAGVGLFHILGKLLRYLQGVSGTRSEASYADATQGVNKATSATRESVMSANGMQAGVGTTMGGGATTAAVSSAVVASMAIRAAANTAASAASASGGMAAVVSAGGAVAAVGVSGLTVGTMTTVVTVAASAVVVGSGVLTFQEQVGCAGSDIVQESIGKMRINFRNTDLPPKTVLEDLFVTSYNKVSLGCSEAFQRTVLSASLESYANSGFGVDTLWTATVSCSPGCPAEPLFGRSLEEAELL
eukprot:scaffold543_cov119-Cylindrotheca_fusiformis.AAC.3